MTTWAEDTNLEVELLEAYCLGTTSPEETAQIDAWFNAYPERRAWYEQLKTGLRRGDFLPLSVEERSIAWSEFMQAALQRYPKTEAKLHGLVQSDESVAKVDRMVPPFLGERLVTVGRTSPPRLLRYTLAGLTLGIVAFMIGLFGRPFLPSHRPLSIATYVTGNGQRARITLDDGSTVALGVASRLEVPSDYSAGDRTVRLVGEALFTVTHHGRMPFTVVTNNATTRVLGTSFLVRNYTTDSATLVAVQDGKVAVHSAHVPSLVVAAQEQLLVSPSVAAGLRRADSTLFKFASGVLTLDGLSLRDAILELDRWYDADIRLGDLALADRHVKGEFAAGSLADLTELLTLTFDLRVVRTGRVLTLYPR